MAADLALARRHVINEDEIRRVNVKVLVNSQVIMLCINERIQDQLQLPIVERE
jgi:hypothetical protein